LNVQYQWASTVQPLVTSTSERSGSFRHVHLKRSLLEKNLIIRLGINGPVGIDHVLASELSLVVRNYEIVSAGLVAQEGVMLAGVGIGFGKLVYRMIFGHVMICHYSNKWSEPLRVDNELSNINSWREAYEKDEAALRPSIQDISSS
jgi:hypothetical protein